MFVGAAAYAFLRFICAVSSDIGAWRAFCAFSDIAEHIFHHDELT